MINIYTANALGAIPVGRWREPHRKVTAITERNSTRDRLQLFIDIYKD